jgi:hypothetical protein
MDGLVQIQFVGESQTGWSVLGLDSQGRLWRGYVVGHLGPTPEVRWTRINEVRNP